MKQYDFFPDEDEDDGLEPVPAPFVVDLEQAWRRAGMVQTKAADHNADDTISYEIVEAPVFISIHTAAIGGFISMPGVDTITFSGTNLVLRYRVIDKAGHVGGTFIYLCQLHERAQFREISESLLAAALAPEEAE